MPLGETIGRAYVIILADGSGFADDVKEEIRKHEADFEKGGENVSKRFNSGFRNNNDKELRTGLERFRRGIGRWESKFEKSGGILGRALGRGSRNDFLNAFGGFASILPRLIGGLIGAFGGLIDKVIEIRDRFKELRDAGGGVVSSLLAIGKEGLPGLIAAVAAIGATVGTFAATIGALGSAVSLATGLILALAGSLAFALMGALVAVGGALVPFAAALGVGALALVKMDKKSKVFKDLKGDWRDLQKTAQEGLFGKDLKNLGSLSNAIKAFKPLVESVAKAMGNVLKAFGDATKTKGFQTMIEDISKIIGPMVEKLGSIGGKLATFLGEAFIAAEPIITEFLDWIDENLGKLVDFGKGGKKSGLAKFFSDAWESAKLVGGLIKEIIGLIGDLFSEGKPTGDSIFKELTDQVKKLRAWLDEKKKSGQLQQWFDDAKTLAEKIGEIVKGVGKLIEKLDTPTNRTILFGLLDLTQRLIGLFQQLAGALDWVNGKMIELFGWFSRLGGQGSAWSTLVEGMKANWGGFATAVGTFFTSTLPGFFSGLASKIGGALGNLGGPVAQWLSGLGAAARGAVQSVISFFSGLGGKIIGASGNIGSAFTGWLSSLGGKARTVAQNVVGAFSGLAQKIISRAGSIASAIGTWFASLPGKARAIANQIAGGFAGLAQKIISRAGSIAAAVGSWFASLPGKARQIANQIANAFSGLARKAIDKAGSLASAISSWASGVYDRARGVADDIVRAFSGLASRIVSAIGTIVPNWALPKALRHAAGGIVSAPVVSWVGEAGPEAIVPLNRPLNMVDPSVRALSAFAQGRTDNSTGPGGKTIDVGGITVITPTENPIAVASEVIARMAAAAYI